MNAKRIVVTGMGMVSPLGCGVETAWTQLLQGRSGLVALDEALVEGIPSRVGGVVQGFDPASVADAKDLKKMDRFSLFALAAARDALAQAGWRPETDEQRERTATIVASAVGGFGTIAEAVRTTDMRGP